MFFCFVFWKSWFYTKCLKIMDGNSLKTKTHASDSVDRYWFVFNLKFALMESRSFPNVRLRNVIKLKLNGAACFIISSKCSRDGTQTASALLISDTSRCCGRHTENGKNAGKDVLNPSGTKTTVKPRKQPKMVNYWSSSTAHDRQKSRGDREQSQ